MSMIEKFVQALACLLPTGYAWPRDPDSVLMRVLRGMAASFAALHDFSAKTLQQWQPHLTGQRLAEWEDATGLPNVCFGTEQSADKRRAVLLAKLRGPQGAYTDSSPASPGGIEAICATLGYEASVSYNTPFRVGRNRCGERLGALDGKLYVRVTTQNTLLRVGSGRAGQRLIERTLTNAELECYLRAVVPARFELVVVYL